MTVESKFWSLVDRGNGCWRWLGRHDRGGYGILGINGRAWRVHRLSWEIHNGPIPAGLHVCHKCDVPECVRPDHLFLGTAKDNKADQVSKGRQARGWHPARRGEAHQAARLSDLEVAAIREAVKHGVETQRAIAQRFGISHTYVGMLARGEMRV